MKEIVILHVFDDEKFFDNVSNFFDTLDNVHNRYCFFTPDKNFKFKYIKSSYKIEIYNTYKDYTNLFSDKHIDIIYFQSLTIKRYKLFNYISKEKKIIWWCFGTELYSSHKGLKPLVQIELYKPLTNEYIKKNETNIIHKIKECLKPIIFFKYRYIQNKVIRRIDYFSPVLPIEYEMMKNNSNFKAKPFMLDVGPGIYIPKPFVKISCSKNILIGNSLTYTNNHLDIFDILNKIDIDNSRKYIVPISYGQDYQNDKLTLKNAFRSKQAIWLQEFIPENEYIEYFGSITHAIFGHIRQQAMGNINFCLEKGVKIYLYSDSITYKQLKKTGYIIYTIDNDITSNSLNEPLDEASAKHNYELFCRIIKDRVITANEELIEIMNQ